MSFFEELKRRKVFRVAATYAVVAWILMQIGEVTFPALNIPEWVMSTLVVVLLAGFPIAVIFAWIFDKTPQGYIKTDAPDTENIAGMNVKVDDRPFYLQKRNILLAFGVIAGILIGTYGSSILYINSKVETLSEQENIPIFEADHILKKGKETLFEARKKRVRPHTDEKIITAWNGLMITALATGYAVMGEKKYLEFAKQCADFIWSKQWIDGKLFRVYKDRKTNIAGCLEDYAFFLDALVTLYQTSLESKWISKARQLADVMIIEFWDEEEGGFFLSGKSGKQLVSKLKNPADEALPSANAIASMALLNLGRLTGTRSYIEKSKGTLKAFKPFIEENPVAFTGLLSTLSSSILAPTEAIFVGPIGEPAFEEMWKVLNADYRPNKVTIWNENGKSTLPLAEGKISSEPMVYLCQKGTCYPPANSGKAFDRLLERPQEIRLNIFDENKKKAQILEQEQNNFMGVMGQIFQQSGITRQARDKK